MEGSDERVGVRITISPVRFSPEMKAVLAAAVVQARALHIETVDTSMLLLALVETSTGPGKQSLESFGVTREAVRSTITVDSDPTHQSTSGSPPFSAGAKEALGRANHLASSRGDTLVGDGHLLLGLLEDPRNSATRVLNVLTPGTDDLRRATLERLTQ